MVVGIGGGGGMYWNVVKLRNMYHVYAANEDFVLFRLADNKEYPVSTASETLLRPLPGMYLFHAWHIAPSMAHTVVATPARSDESPLEMVTSDEDTAKSLKPSATSASAEDVPDKDV